MKRVFKQVAPLIVLAVLLTGCGLFGPKEAPTMVEFYRDTSVDLASTTRFDAEAFSGFWNIRAEFGRTGETHTRAGVEFQRGSNGEIVQIVLHGPKRRRRFGAVAHFEVDQAAPGRFIYGDPPYATEYWVLWVDADYKTAAIGTPSGTFGWIIDRSRTGGSDRVQAAKEVLEWMGYDMTKLVNLP